MSDTRTTINTAEYGAPNGGPVSETGAPFSDTDLTAAAALGELDPTIYAGAGQTPDPVGGPGGTGGDATIIMTDDVIGTNADPLAGAVNVSAFAQAGGGGYGWVNGSGFYNGGNGGDATAIVTYLSAYATGPIYIGAIARAGAGGNGAGPGASPGLNGTSVTDISGSVLVSEQEVAVYIEGSISNFDSPRDQTTLSSNTITAPNIYITVPDAPSVNFTNNVVTLSAPLGPAYDYNSLTIQLSYDGKTPLSSGPNGNFLFSGNSFVSKPGGTFFSFNFGGIAQGSSFSTGLPAGVTIDTSANTISIGGSPTNTFSGFSVFQVQANLTFIAGAGNYTIYEQATGTIVDTPSSGSVTVLGFGGQNQTLDFEGFGPSLNAQTIQSDISVANGNTTITAPGGSKIILEGFTGTIPTSDFVFTACYAAGTRIAALRDDGRCEIAVEDLRIGDRAITIDGTARPIVWTGHRRIDLARLPDPEPVRPVRIRAGAFADGIPIRDLLLSPDHAVYVDGALTPVRLLCNGRSILTDYGPKAVIYFHVELDAHAILLAEGLPAESYLDTGNRGAFENADGAVLLHADFDAGDRRALRSCAKLLTDPASTEPVWHRLAARAGVAPPSAGDTTDDPDLHIRIGDRAYAPLDGRGGRFLFALPAAPSGARLVSRTACPASACPWIDDRRRLGVQVSHLALQAASGERTIGLDNPSLQAGWWLPERDGKAIRRWTDGNANLPGWREPVLLEVGVGGTLAYACQRPSIRHALPRQ